MTKFSVFLHDVFTCCKCRYVCLFLVLSNGLRWSSLLILSLSRQCFMWYWMLSHQMFQHDDDVSKCWLCTHFSFWLQPDSQLIMKAFWATIKRRLSTLSKSAAIPYSPRRVKVFVQRTLIVHECIFHMKTSQTRHMVISCIKTYRTFLTIDVPLFCQCGLTITGHLPYVCLK